MPTIMLRDVPDNLRDQLREAARERGRSLPAECLALLGEALAAREGPRRAAQARWARLRAEERTAATAPGRAAARQRSSG